MTLSLGWDSISMKPCGDPLVQFCHSHSLSECLGTAGFNQDMWPQFSQSQGGQENGLQIRTPAVAGSGAYLLSLHFLPLRGGNLGCLSLTPQ